MNQPLFGARTADTARGRRRKPRARVALVASIEGLHGRRQVLVHDVSETGAMIEGENLPAVGSDVIVRCRDIDVLATIVWARKNRCGVHFDEPADSRQIIRLRMESDRIASSGRTPEELEAARDWRFGQVR